MIAVAPSELVEVICETPGICAICRSSGWATEEAMVSGDAPGRLALTWMVGKVDLRQRRDRQQRIGDEADEQDRRHHQRGGDGMADERAGDASVSCGSAPAAGVGFDGDARARLQAEHGRPSPPVRPR